MANFRSDLSSILSRHIEAAVDESLAAYRILLGTDGVKTGRGAPGVKRGKRPGVGKKVSAALKGRACPFPGCTKPTKGPRFRFFCEEHRALPAARQAEIIAAAKGDASKATAPKKTRRAKRGKKIAAKSTRRTAPLQAVARKPVTVESTTAVVTVEAPHSSDTAPAANPATDSQ